MKLKILLISLLMSISIFTSQAQQNPNLSNGIAVEGYDVVSYFSGKPTKGSKSFLAAYDHAIYYFSNLKNKQLFLSNPEKYAPKYGGWCAYAMGLDGSKVEIDPETYKIIDGHLYLFYNAYFNNTKTKWDNEETKFKSNADKNWTKLKSK